MMNPYLVFGSGYASFFPAGSVKSELFRTDEIRTFFIEQSSTPLDPSRGISYSQSIVYFNTMFRFYPYIKDFISKKLENKIRVELYVFYLVQIYVDFITLIP